MVKVDLKELIKLMRFRPSLEVTSNWFGVSEDSIQRVIKKADQSTFSQFRARHSQHIHQKLVERAIEMAMEGNTTMMIFLLKSYCHMSELPKSDSIDHEPIWVDPADPD